MCNEARSMGCCNCPYYIASCEYCTLSEGYIDNTHLLLDELEKNYEIRANEYNKE
ncbi:MAG: hypothetical protein MSS80_08315 [Mollicutes bacterium]|nr:hypothetical protein [Mollicutes bacterium]